MATSGELQFNNVHNCVSLSALSGNTTVSSHTEEQEPLPTSMAPRVSAYIEEELAMVAATPLVAIVTATIVWLLVVVVTRALCAAKVASLGTGGKAESRPSPKGPGRADPHKRSAVGTASSPSPPPSGDGPETYVDSPPPNGGGRARARRG